MGIRFPWHVCNKRLNVKAFLAGKRGICPHCGTKVDIPWHSEGEASAGEVDESYVPRSVSPGTASGPASGGGNGHSRGGPSGGFGPTTVPVSGRAGQAANSPGTIPVGGSSPPGSGAGASSSSAGLSSRPADQESQTALSGAPSTNSATSSPEPPPVSGANDPIDEAPDAVWYVRPPTGGQFGPASGEIMRRWMREGRVSADSLVWREGWP